jgi:class 3 adenylate cyclase
MSTWLETASGDKIPIQGNCSLGRDPSNTLVLPGKLVSRRHAMIHTQGKEHWLVDLGSANGVLLNGRRVKQPVALKDQDRLEIDANVLTYREAVGDRNAASSQDTTSSQTLKAASRTADLWLLVADIEKFTPLSQTMPGDQLAKLVGKWILTCKEIIEEHHGDINKYLGDGFLAYWPSPNIQPEVIAKTLAKLKEMQATSQLPFRLVVHRGKVTVDNGLSDGEDELIGPDVNFVFRMEKVAGKANQHCVISAAAAEQLKAFGPVTPQGAHTLGGFEGTHQMYSY